jgi:hypothetical protein
MSFLRIHPFVPTKGDKRRSSQKKSTYEVRTITLVGGRWKGGGISEEKSNTPIQPKSEQYMVARDFFNYITLAYLLGINFEF